MRNNDGTISPDVAWESAWNQQLTAIISMALEFKTKEELYNWMDLHPLWKQENRDEIFAAWSQHNKRD